MKRGPHKTESQLPVAAFDHDLNEGLPVAAITCHDFFEKSSEFSVDLHKPHQINFYLIALLTNGACNHMVDFINHSMQAGTALFVQKGQVHRFDTVNNLDGWIVVFTEDFLLKTIPVRSGFPVLQLLNQSVGPSKIQFDEAELGNVIKILEQIELEMKQPDYGFREAILTRLLGLFLLKAEQVAKKQIDYDRSESQHLSRFVEFQRLIDKNVRKRWSVSEYANELGLTTRTLGTITRLLVDSSPKTFIDYKVILEIKRLLTHTDQSISALARDFGFEDATNMVKFYRRNEGETPGSFRKRIQASSES